ncbi:MAG: carbohydrate ABC transporter permease [Filifactoraceae bacterium]
MEHSPLKGALSEKVLNRKRKIREAVVGYLFLLPALTFFLTFVLYPMTKGIYLSFFKFRGRNQEFVGFSHYKGLLEDQVFIRSLVNTTLITAIAVPIVVVFALFVAMNIYDKSPKVRSFFRGIFYIPAISSVVSVTVVWSWIYHPQYGILNYALKSANILSENVDWLGGNATAIYGIIAILITTSVGQPIILYVASLGNVPKDYIEAATIDGANNWTIFKRIIWPQIMPTTLYIVVVTTINSFQIFALIQLLTAGGPNYRTSTVMYLVYQKAIQEGRFGVSSAMGVVLAIIIAMISLLQFKFLSKDID